MSASASKHPRNLGQFFNGNKSMSGEVPVQKPTTPIVDRFNAMVRERAAEISRVSSAAAAAADDEGIVRLYELVLSELTSNSKPLITDLTVIAREQREHGQGIAGSICARILEVPGEQKLRFLYLLDSIVKTIGKEYVRYFSFHLPKVFCEAYRQAHPNLYPAMRHLFRTWSTVFPPSVLGNIEAQLQFSPSANHQSSVLTSLRAFESPRPTHGIHVNPKYLEARRQFEQSAADSSNQHAKGRTSTVKLYGRKPGSGYDEYDSNNAEVMSSLTGAERLSSTDHVGGTSFTLGAEKLAPSSDSRFARLSSSLRTQHATLLSAPGDEFAVNSSPRKVVDRASPSHLGFEYGLGRTNGREESSSDWLRTHWSDGAYRRFETSAAHNNGVELQGPRALIHAYGNNQSRQTPTSKPLKIDTIGVDDKVGTRMWQNTEEEEFDWEDMSPNFVGSSQSDNLLASSMHPLDSYTTIPGYGKHSAAPLDTDLSRSNGSSEAQISTVNDSSISLEHVVPTVSSGCGSSSNNMGLCDETTQFLGFHYPREARDFPSSLAQASQCPVSSKGPRDFQMYPSSGGVQKPLINGFLDSSAQHHGSCFVSSSMGTARTDSWKSKAISTVVPPSTGPWPPLDLHTSHALPMLPRLPLRQFDSINGCNKVLNQGLTKSFLPELQFTSTEKNVPSSLRLHSFPNRQAGPIPSNPQYPGQVTSARPQLLPSQDIWQNLVLPKAVTTPSVVPPLTHGYTPQWHNTGTSNVLSNPIPGVHPSMAILNTPSRSLHLHGGGLLPLPLGPHPVSSQMIPISHNPIAIAPDLQAGTAFSGLIDSLMAQGLISLTSQAPVKDSVGPAFNPDILKVRHESAVTALYADLPRQCTTCGHRFKCQEEHGSHMDWHVTKNRISKSRKQKPSRKWFVNVSLWLTGAEALGTDAIPGFLPAESVVEQKDDEDFAVPADEDQNSCALCGEPFDDFYSDEIEEWMYKGAVYLNAPSKSTKNIDRSHLGPIVHAKCRSESSAVSPEDFGQDEGGYIGDGSQRKRLRSSLI